MKKVFFGIFVMGIILALSTSCEKTGDTGMTLSFKSGTTTMKSISAGDIDFTAAMIGVHEIEIELESEDFNGESEIEYDYEGNYMIDLLTSMSTPELGFTNFEPGTYNKLEAEIRPILDGGTKSVILKGTFTDAQLLTGEFEFSTASEIEFEIESETGFYLEEGTILDMVIIIDLAMLFDGVDFSNAVRNDMDVVIINDTSNMDLAAIIKANINLHSELEEDSDDH